MGGLVLVPLQEDVDGDDEHCYAYWLVQSQAGVVVLKHLQSPSKPPFSVGF